MSEHNLHFFKLKSVEEIIKHANVKPYIYRAEQALGAPGV